MTNKELKKQIRNCNLALWQVAEQIGVCEMTLVRWLRSEKDTTHQNTVLNALNELCGGGISE